MVVFAVMASVVAIRTPAWESADEPSHVQNVQTLVGGHWYRIPRDLSQNDTRRFTLELHQPPLYYLLLAGVQKAAGRPAQGVSTGPAVLFLHSLRRGMFLHHSAAQHRFLLLLRLPNVFLGLLTIAFTFLTVRALTRDPWTPVIAAAIVAFMPRFVFLSAFVTNDNLVNALGAVLAYCSVRCVLAPTLLWAAAVGAVLGLLVITKLSALPAAVVLIPVLLARREWIRRAETIAVAAAALVVVCGWYLVQNRVRYGDPLAISTSQHYLQLTGGLETFGTPYVVTHPWRLVFSNVPARIVRGFWYESGWHQFLWPLTSSLVFWAGLVFALTGLAPRSFNRARNAHPEGKALAALGLIAAAGFASVWIVAFETRSYEPRLALLGLPALASLAALGLQRWRLPIRSVLPLMCLIGTLVAIRQDVLSVNWNH
jgi:hypothetical protein